MLKKRQKYLVWLCTFFGVSLLAFLLLKDTRNVLVRCLFITWAALCVSIVVMYLLLVLWMNRAGKKFYAFLNEGNFDEAALFAREQIECATILEMKNWKRMYALALFSDGKLAALEEAIETYHIKKSSFLGLCSLLNQKEAYAGYFPKWQGAAQEDYAYMALFYLRRENDELAKRAVGFMCLSQNPAVESIAFYTLYQVYRRAGEEKAAQQMYQKFAAASPSEELSAALVNLFE